jgi:hypothetical protein
LLQVLFVDYGTSGRVKKSKLRFMHLKFTTFPVQAIKASLANLKPSDGAVTWPCKVTERFFELVSDKNLVAVVSSVDHEVTYMKYILHYKIMVKQDVNLVHDLGRYFSQNELFPSWILKIVVSSEF